MNLESQTNQAFSGQIAAKKMAHVLQEFALLTCRSDFSLSTADLKEIELARKSAEELVGVYFKTIHEKAVERRANLQRYADLDFISLGEDCLSRTVANQWGLKRSAKLGELTHPFDLAVHPLPRIAGLLESDFENHTNPENLQFLKHQNCCRNDALNIRFNHELGEKYAENDFALLREIYQRRIANLRRRLSEGGRIVFLLHLAQQRPNAFFHLKKISAALKRRCQAADFLIVCINTTGKGPIVDDARRKILEKESIRFVDIDYPVPGYVWYAPKYCFTPEGHEFEKRLISSVKAVVDAWR